ncbi:MAG: tetratricopeptide repeat protein, partial [Candidatus Methanofastidiosia archaeon]
MTEEAVLKVFISSTYKDLKAVRNLLISKIEKGVTAVAMEKFIPVDSHGQKISVKELKDSDVCIFIIGDYYGTVIDKCISRTKDCGDCPGTISFTHCEYKKALQSGKPHMVYIVETEISKILSQITKFDLESVNESDIHTFLERNNIDSSKADLFTGYTLEEIEELWGISRKNNGNLEKFKKEVKGVKIPRSYKPVIITKKEDYKKFQDNVLNDLRENIVRWYGDKKINFGQFAGRRKELEDFLGKLHNRRSVCVVGTGGVGKTTLIQLGLLLEKLSGRKVYALVRKYSYKYTRAGYSLVKGKFKEKTFRDHLTLKDVVDIVFEEDIRLKNIEEMGEDDQVSIIIKELDKEGSVLFIDDLQDASDSVKRFVYTCGNNLKHGAVVAGVRESGQCYSTVGPLTGMGDADLKDMIRIKAKIHDKEKYILDNINVWNREILRITQGHPMLVDIIVGNADLFPDCGKLKGITGVTTVEGQEAVNEVMDRLIRDILTEEEYEVLRGLSVFSVPVERRVFEIVGEMEEETLNGIIKKGFLVWDNNRLFFTFDAVRELLEAEVPLEAHDNAVKYYRGGLKDGDDDRNLSLYLEIIYHLVKQGKIEKGLELYFGIGGKLDRVHRGRVVAVSKLLVEQVSDQEKRALIFGTMGNLLLKGKEFSEVEGFYTEALKIRRTLAQKDPTAYEPDVAMTLNNLGTLYSDLRDFKKAEKSFTKALKIYRTLAQKDPTAYEPDVAMTLNNLGNLYRNLRDFKKAEESYTEALKIRRTLAQKDPTAYEPDVAMTLNNLGTLYWNLRDFKKAEKSYTEALKIRRTLAQKDPTAYEPDVAMTLNNLGTLYSDLRDFKKAEKSYTEALKIYRTLAQKDPTAYEPDVAMTLNNLGTLYWNLRDFKKAE